ncbi:hypothetical protein E2562_017862 [Oryza meyeriana var. granulata]|uniref:Uncharacterized protein n=1 Tax=Oryza meyeriana var. granulata TaxID=110450 RepID=A0A6G1E0D0_9ORYZ|nr:hypothetical protein E2562_017862 [Oryza meyeriana var. granulata]
MWLVTVPFGAGGRVLSEVRRIDDTVQHHRRRSATALAGIFGAAEPIRSRTLLLANGDAGRSTCEEEASLR